MSVGVLHFRGRILPYRWGRICGQMTVLHFGGSKLDSFPMWELTLQLKEESVTPSLCGEG